MKADKLNINLGANPKRVVLQFFFPITVERASRVIERVKSLSETKIKMLLDDVVEMFSKRHRNYENSLLENFNKIERILREDISVSYNRKLLIGSYFSKEYSIESAALFNPSIVPHYLDSEEGAQRFIMSLRATGEGHISSIEFREGIISKDQIQLLEDNGMATMAVKAEPQKISKEFIIQKNLEENILSAASIDQLPNEISIYEIVNLKSILSEQEYNYVLYLLDTNYQAEFNEEISLNKRILFPISKAEAMGMEDVRLVKFNDEYNSKYYGTYTAYNGKKIQSQIIETEDFTKFNIHSLHGKAASDKGMALFPRLIDGKYVMTSRIDGENMYLMSSDDLFLWKEAVQLRSPLEPWEYVQLGNCGSPIEIDEGWLLLTHAVGPMRRYVMGAMLLDKNDPTKVKAVSKTPLIEPDENERDGYVPNVVYSCGSMLYNNSLIIPYAVSDSACSFAKVELHQLLKSMQ